MTRFLALLWTPANACARAGASHHDQRCRRNLGFMDLAGVIDVRPGVRSGKPCFVGTRIAVYDVLEYLASGMTPEEIVADFPELTVAHIRATLAFAAVRERRLATPA